MDYTGIFIYDASNLLLTPDDIVIVSIAVVAGIVFVFLLRMILLGIAGFFLVREAEKKVMNRKKVLSDLILMKDIQTELEKEIEQAMLKSAFQN